MTSMFSLQGRTAAIVGGGSGIGEAVAIGCAEAGAGVHCLDIDAEAAAGTAATIRAAGGEANSARLDIVDGAAVTAAFSGIATAHGSLDVVVCTPGVNVRKPLLDYTDDEIDRVLGLNLKGGAHVIQAAGRIMRAQGSGSIILFSSIRSVVVEPGQSMYAATKAGIVQMVRAAAAELGPHGVRVNAVAPGVIDTPLTAPIRDNPDWYGAYAARNIFNRWGCAREMAGPTVFLASDAASYVTGTVLFADGGWTAVDGRFTPPGM
ncbi:MAG: SDR family oxidoreductase [Gemmatimonadetes bacterium]|nr:SDR family oxidoreductase [Gemmatimonadota bacterium]MXX72336.1 SDR family oxidoreductase [Gemmatimonadota bacterium]MYC92466.1 SDR family oxidoreductase [Gemmatimonadota bacterium]MYG35205.1 SDR family oxidoreductase [Gemmatimonadota bacterium]MYJ17475.1 SDR family oxidoreductase [Gemmatimonadota bacterium]